jgi:hypothetical protein
MAITYTWTFPQFDTAPTEQNLQNVVKTIHWRLTGVDPTHTLADGTNPSVTAYGTVALDAADPANFVQFASLTKDWAIAKVSTKLDVAATETAIANQIAALINPPIVHMQPPFGA